MPATGPSLRRERLLADVKVVAVAARMKRHRQTVHNIERSAWVDVETASAYLNAVRDIATERSGAE